MRFCSKKRYYFDRKRRGFETSNVRNASAIVVSQSPPSHFDDHGVESYELKCNYCGSSLTGIIDPYDGTLPLSAK
jgi:hypothetical protein